MRSKVFSEILDFFPSCIKERFGEISDENWKEVKEIRIRNGKPIIVSSFNKEVLIDCVLHFEDILRLVENFSENSIYKVQSEINEGFITIGGGHRIGVTGTSTLEDGKIKNIKYISSLNIRVAREVVGCSDKLLDVIGAMADFRFLDNTIIVSPPGCGKTTMLRDLVRNLSNGYKGFMPQTVGVVDERNEISATYQGEAQNDLGLRTDVIVSCPKSIGMRLMVRSMGIDVVATDEIGTYEDVLAIEDAMVSGVNLLVTCHGNCLADVPKSLLEKRVFRNVVILAKGSKPGFIKNIYRLKGDCYDFVY